MASVEQLWWIALGTGLVVAVVAWMLLAHLLITVKRIERNVSVLWNTATTVARNTATTWQLGQTGDALEEIKAEALLHDALLSGAAPVAGPTGGPTS